jgi:hypothetical protein
METELVFPSPVIEEMVDVIAQDVLEAAVDSPHLTILEHNELPIDTGLALFDDRLGLYCRDDKGVTKVSVDTESPEAVAWGESIYQEIRDEAHGVNVVRALGSSENI